MLIKLFFSFSSAVTGLVLVRTKSLPQDYQLPVWHSPIVQDHSSSPVNRGASKVFLFSFPLLTPHAVRNRLVGKKLNILETNFLSELPRILPKLISHCIWKVSGNIHHVRNSLSKYEFSSASSTYLAYFHMKLSNLYRTDRLSTLNMLMLSLILFSELQIARTSGKICWSLSMYVSCMYCCM